MQLRSGEEEVALLIVDGAVPVAGKVVTQFAVLVDALFLFFVFQDQFNVVADLVLVGLQDSQDLVII